ncbi:S8 family peptidase [Candidatus Woesearchaeota archaeon]|nr:S8 family peptidase [Candidatus Woesearchaeota archaeon]OGV93004.1 MAG: hypothetical protein A3B57_00765 [Microgenomates group bacterium RIFCSPLOWO2_01_FULL_47_10]
MVWPFRRQEKLHSLLLESIEQHERDPLELIVEAENKQSLAEKLRPRFELRHVYSRIPHISIRCDKKAAIELVNLIEGQRSQNEFPGVAGIELAHDFSAILGNAETHSSNLWNLEDIGVRQAHEYSRGAGARVGIIDSGCDYSHEEIGHAFGKLKGFDFLNNSQEPRDLNGHGTHVAGTVAGSSVGVAPEAQVYALRVLDENGSGSEADVMAAIEWALEYRLDAVNMSLGSRFATKAFERLCKHAADAGLLLIAAAGNEGFGPSYPASFDKVISVAAVDQENRHARFSNIYRTTDISAPGVGIKSCYPGNEYAALSGTSMAAPHVTGSLALVAARAGSNAAELLEQTAQALSTELPYDPRDVFGAGLVRADELAKAAYRNSKLVQLLGAAA